MIPSLAGRPLRAVTRYLTRASLTAMLVFFSATGCEPEYNNGTMIQLRGKVTNVDGEPLTATVALFNSPGFFSDYVNLTQVHTSSTGHYEIALRVTDCISMMLEVAANGYHTKHVSGFSGKPYPECRNQAQSVDVTLEVSP